MRAKPAVILLLSLFAMASLLQGEESRRQVRINGRTLFVPEGFDVELAAGPPLVERPICVSFDPEGHLYVAESSGSNAPVQQQLKERPHRILRLEDTDGDGVFDRRTVFADRMMFPEGVLWYRGSVYVAAPPSIWKLTDTDGDGVADVRQEWFLGKTLTHCANDLHGPYLGPEGWLYWCKGAFAKQTYPRFDGPPFVTSAAHVFRCPPDAPIEPNTNAIDPRYVEPVMTGGMDNPVEVVFTPEGEPIFSTTFLVHPAGGLRDGLIHAVYGGMFGKAHRVLDGHPRTGDLLPPLLHMGPAAACGLERYRSGVFGPDFRDNLFVCSFNLHQVFRVTLAEEGAGYTAKAKPFFGSPEIDFHPTDVAEDAEGSLLVVDTGGWYKLCCPSSQLWKPDVLGAIYRIRKRGAKGPNDPRGQRVAWNKLSSDELARLLGDPRPAVAERAIEEAARRGDTSTVEALGQALRRAPAWRARVRAIWALARIGSDSALRQVQSALSDKNHRVRRAALHVASVLRMKAARDSLVELLNDEDPFVRRRAAEALGRLRDPSAVPHLLRGAARTKGDRWLEHAIIYALIEIDAPEPTRAGLEADDPRTQSAALVALDQMRHGDLRPAEVLRFLEATDQHLRRTALWVLKGHPDWAPDSAAYLAKRLALVSSRPEIRSEVRELLIAFSTAPTTQRLLAHTLNATRDPEIERFVLETMRDARVGPLPQAWVPALQRLLSPENPNNGVARNLAVDVLYAHRPRSVQAAVFAETLLSIAKDRGVPEVTRLKALACLPPNQYGLSDELFRFVLNQLDPTKPVAVRSLAAEALARAGLKKAQLLAVTERIPNLGPLDLEALLPVYRVVSDGEVVQRLREALLHAPARTGLNLNLIQEQKGRYSAAVQEILTEVANRVQEEIAERRQKIVELLKSLPPGDIRRGQAVFNSEKAACSSCHAIGYLGGRVGPDLTRIGRVRSKLELLEAIVDPSASIIRSYEPVLVMTSDGRVINGLVTERTPDELVLVTGPNQYERVPVDQVEAMKQSTVSVMPAGLDQQLTRQELADLLEFLSNCR